MRHETPYTPALFRQGLTLIVILGLAGSCILFLLSSLWNNIGKAAREDQQRSQLVCGFNDCLASLSRYSYDMIMFCTIGDNQSQKRLAPDIAQFKLQMDALQPVDDTSQASLTQMRESIVSTILQAGQLAPTIQDSYFSDDLDRIKRFRKIAHGGMLFVDKVQNISEQQKNNLLLSKSSQEEALHHMQALVFVTFLIGNFFVLILLFVSTRRAISRLRILVKSGTSLSKLQPAETRLGGTDELAYLDTVFNTVSKELQDAAEQRRSIMQMIAHDMRSPMMAADVNLEIFRELMMDSLSDVGKNACTAAQGACQSILDYVTDLIALDRAEADSSDRTATTNDIDQELPLSEGNYFRSTTFRKGLLLALVSLIIQSCWMISMQFQIKEAQNLAAQMHRQAETVVGINLLWASVFRAQYEIAFFHISNKLDSKTTALQNLNAAQRELQELELLLPDTNEKRMLLTELQNVIPQLRSNLDLHNTPQGSVGLALLPALANRVERLNERLQSSAEAEGKELAATVALQDTHRQRIVQLIFLAVALNVLISLALLWFFSQAITRRVNVLVDIARGLPSRAPIQATVRGSDEIQYLYKLLLKAADDLKQSDDKRVALIAAVSNFIGTPSKAIQAALPSLEAELKEDTPEWAVKSLTNAKFNVQRVVELTNDLFAVDQSDALELDLEECSIAELFEQVLASTSALAERKNISLETNAPTMSWSLDRRLMVRVFINLISNAIKFSPKDSLILLSAIENDSGIEFKVKDSGTGMKEEDVAKIFEKYYRVPGQTEKGFGLGLNFCRMVAELHHGEIRCSSQLGAGSTFTVSLPKLR
ncbi:MAG: HAMP domain-containing histidine kinase [Candidatus Melainabacteria bacterium]|nr:HAMP domain-containing histidine kinase [Candidatus Melainabacteria bacterium]